MTSTHSHNTAPYLKKVDLLPDFQKKILQLCSIIYGPADISTLLSCLYTCNLKTNIERQNYGREIQQSLDHLKEQKLINSKHECNKSIVEIISRQAVEDNLFSPMSKAVQKVLPAPSNSHLKKKTTSRFTIRNLRIDLYNNNIANFHQHLINYHQNDHQEIHPIVIICNNPFSPDWIASLPDHVQFLILHEILKHATSNLETIDQQIDFLETTQVQNQNSPIERHTSFLYLYLSSLIVIGKISKAQKIIDQRKESLVSFGITGWLDFISGNSSCARKSFKQDLQSLRKMNGNKNAFFTGLEGVIYCLAHFDADEHDEFCDFKTICNSIKTLQKDNIFYNSYKYLVSVIECKSQNLQYLPITTATIDFDMNAIDCLILSLAHYWIEGRLPQSLQALIEFNFEKALKNDYHWIAHEFAEILFKLTREKFYQNFITQFKDRTSVSSLLRLINHEEPWKRAIYALEQIATQNTISCEENPSRLIWLIETTPNTNEITGLLPRIQKRSNSGNWSRGRIVSLSRFLQPNDFTFLSDQDKQICASIRNERESSNGGNYYIDIAQGIIALVGHPLLFRADCPTVQVEAISKEAELHIHDSGKSVQINFLPFPDENHDIIFRFETLNRLTVFHISNPLRRIANIIGQHGLHVPSSEKEHILLVISSISKHLNIHSDLIATSGKLKNIKADNTIHCHLSPYDKGFKVSLLVKPIAENGPYYKPGNGSRAIITQINGNQIQISRNLLKEEENANKVEEQCTSLSGNEIDEWEYIIQNIPTCLQLLQELQSASKFVIVEWPKGEMLRLCKIANASQLYVKVSKKHSWFELEGSLQIDPETILDMEQLLTMVAQNDSRFIPLSNGKYFSLTKELHQHLEQLNSIGRIENKKMQLSPLAVPFLLELKQDLSHFSADEHWEVLEDRIRSAEQYNPQVPSTLQAELRSYQTDGFKWLSRLAYIGCGACLADEMGLGKTVQALALILDQAIHGPSLVIAPTSVCHNWVDEASRFTPTLNIHVLTNDNRQKTIKKLKKFDVLVTSYGLLQHEHEIISDKQWQVIVLDEAQAIKNMATKRSNAAMNLRGRFKLLTTGTPLENNLGELWNLFRFITPGLLGSISQFNKRFAAPIEKEKKRHVQNRLKKIIKPFVLRRLKSQVLEELPPRTEINLKVELSTEETALYESLRVSALQKLEAAQNEPGNKQIKILAEIMKLRRACCNPSLVAPQLSLTSSKLTLFEEIIDELQSNKNKVLVFSQFVGHLSIIKEFLERKQIDFQYLDGSTPAHQRKVRVEAFQAGQGDVFLISLKAGGLGLNLTAANYVIHMDPWWNPAVEDQASDRVHRIGQKLPVTIYRLIAKNTIEEKIVTLHREKRELADKLLKGTEVSSKISSDELMRLLLDA